MIQKLKGRPESRFSPATQHWGRGTGVKRERGRKVLMIRVKIMVNLVRNLPWKLPNSALGAVVALTYNNTQL